MRALAAALLATTLGSCRACDDPPRANDASAEVPSASASAPLALAAPDAEAPADGGAAVDAAVDAAPSDAAAEAEGDAGPSACRVLYGPAEQPFRGPAAMTVVGQELRLVANDGGRPRVFPIPIAPIVKGAPPVVPPAPSTFVGMRWPPCELAGRFVYCQAPGGPVMRTTLATNEVKEVAKSRSGTRIAAAALGPDHAVVAYLELRRTTEGDMLQAFVALDDREPVRLSDDGAGATTLRFLGRGEEAIAVYLDARTAMVPVHARAMAFAEGKLALRDDTVLFVGGTPERGIDLAVASAGAKSFAFVPMPRETLDFGMAAIPIEDPPKEDVAATWSRYPNGLDPAPIAAAPARDGRGAWVLRVRPRAKEPTSPRVLELGRFDASATFTSLGEIEGGARSKGITDVAVVEDAAGAVWLLYGSTTSTWLERRVCP